MKPTGGLWPPHDIVLLKDGKRVSVDGSPGHGSWFMSSFHLALTFQCPFHENNEETCLFVKADAADTWVQVRCVAEMHCILIRPMNWCWTPSEIDVYS